MVSNEAIVASVRAMRLVTYFDVAAATVFIWDYVLTLTMELDLVWRSKWNTLKVIYLLQRYLPFVDTVALVLYHQTSTGLTNTMCRNVYMASGSLIVIGMACSEIILTVRAWAVWHRSVWLGSTLIVLYILIWGPSFVFLAVFLKSLQFDNPDIHGFIGCLLTRAKHIVTMCWVVVLVWDALILGLMVLPAIREYSVGGNTALLDAVFRDGALYYLVLFLLSTVNIIIVKLLPPQYSQLLTAVARCFHSMLTSRVLLQIRSITSPLAPVFRQSHVDNDDDLDHLDDGVSPVFLMVPLPPEETSAPSTSSA